MSINLALAALIALATQTTAPVRTTWAKLTHAEVWIRGRHTVYEFGPRPGVPPEKGWVRRTRTLDNGPTVDWADSIRCPGVARVVKALGQLPPVRPLLPVPRDGEIQPHGIVIILEVESSYGGTLPSWLTIQSRGGTPLDAFATFVRTELEPCWSATPPA